MKKMTDLRDLLVHEINDLYSAEEQIIAALPKMIDAARNQSIKTALSEHLRITKAQKQRLNKVRSLLGEEVEQPKKKGLLAGIFSGSKTECKGMKGIIEEGNSMLGADATPEVKDAAIIACAQKVEHYEICGYGTVISYAREIGEEEVAKLLQQTLNEEYEADRKLTDMAERRVNAKAEGEKKVGRSASSSARSAKSGERASAQRELVPAGRGRKTGDEARERTGKTAPASRTAGARKATSPAKAQRKGSTGRKEGEEGR